LAHLGFSSLLLYSSLSTSDSSCGVASLPKVSTMEQPTGLPSLRAFSAAFFSAPAHITSCHGRRLLTTEMKMKGTQNGEEEENGDKRRLLYRCRPRCYASFTSILRCIMRKKPREERGGFSEKTNKWPHIDLGDHSASLDEGKEEDQKGAAVNRCWSKGHGWLQ